MVVERYYSCCSSMDKVVYNEYSLLSELQEYFSRSSVNW